MDKAMATNIKMPERTVGIQLRGKDCRTEKLCLNRMRACFIEEVGLFWVASWAEVGYKGKTQRFFLPMQ